MKRGFCVVSISIVCFLPVQATPQDESDASIVESEQTSREDEINRAVSEIASGDRARQEEARLYLRRLPPKTVGTRVKPLLKSKDAGTRRQVLKLLQDVGFRGASNHMRRMLLSDGDPLVRREASHAFAALHPDESIPALTICATVDIQISVKRAAILDLGRIRNKKALSALIGLLEEYMEKNDVYLVHVTLTALTHCTGRSFGANVEGWRHFAEDFGKEPEESAESEEPEDPSY